MRARVFAPPLWVQCREALEFLYSRITSWPPDRGVELLLTQENGDLVQVVAPVWGAKPDGPDQWNGCWVHLVRRPPTFRMAA